MGGIGVGVAALVITLAILSGFEKTLTENMVGFTSDAEIGSYGGRPLPDYQGTTAFLFKKVPGITSISPYVERQAILRSSHGVSGVVLRGVLPTDTSVIATRKIIRGANLAGQTGDSTEPIIISEGLAHDLGTDVGKSLAAIRFNDRLRTREDILANLRKFKIVGIFSTGMAQYDNSIAYTTLAAAQHFNSMSPTQVTGFSIKTASLDQANTITAEINRTLHYPYFARSVYEIYPTIFAWIELQKKPIPIILGLIILVATFNIISTLLLIVIEKTHSVGVLKTLGARSRSVGQIFIDEGMVISIAGTLAGDLLAFLICQVESHFHFFRLRSDVYFMSHVPISIEWQHYVIVSTIAITLALCATLIPARIAARMQPLTALNFR